MRTIAVEVYIKKDNRILMVQENKEKIKGKWNMPAGKLENSETLIEAAIRETKEETGLDITIKGLIAVLENVASLGQLVVFYFMGEYIGGELKCDNIEISDVKWMTEEEIKSLDKKSIRGGETIDDILDLAKKELIPLDRIKIERFEDKKNTRII